MQKNATRFLSLKKNVLNELRTLLSDLREENTWKKKKRTIEIIYILDLRPGNEFLDMLPKHRFQKQKQTGGNTSKRKK